jgi:hypothetical protein
MYIINYNEWRRVYEETEAAALQSTAMLRIQAALSKRGKSLPDLEAALATLVPAGDDVLTDDSLPITEARLNESYTEEAIDIVIDCISALLSTIPLAGTVVSKGIDIAHIVSYAIRSWFASDAASKVTNIAMAIVGISTLTMPAGAGLLNIGSRAVVNGGIALAKSSVKKLASSKVASFAIKKGVPTWQGMLSVVLATTLKDTVWNTLSTVTTNLKSINSSLTKSIAGWRSWPIVGSAVGYLLDALGWVSTNISYCVSNIAGVKAALSI